MSIASRNNAEVDVLITNWNTLPWLKLNVAQSRRLNFLITPRLHIWDDASTDGSLEWLQRSGLQFHRSGEKVGHAKGLVNLISATQAEYIAILDVDAIPILAGWLEEAVIHLKDGRCGMAGLEGGGEIKGRKFIHPSFCVFRRKLFHDLSLKVEVIHKGDILFDVGQFMCMQIQDAGYRLDMIGKSQCLPSDAGFLNKVYHFWGSTNVLTGNDQATQWQKAQEESARRHKKLLTDFGLWNEFRVYIAESAGLNKRCEMYL